MTIHDREYIETIQNKTAQIMDLYTDEDTPEVFFHALVTTMSVFLQTWSPHDVGKVYENIDRLHRLLVESVYNEIHQSDTSN